MVRYREVKKYGNAWMIHLSPQDVIDFNLKLGDMIDIEDAVVNKSLPKELYNKMIKKKRKSK